MHKNVLKLLLVATVFSAAVSVFLVIAHELFSEKEYEFDDAVLHYATAHLPTRRLVSVMAIVSFFGSADFLTPCYLSLLIYLLMKKRIMPAAFILSTGLSGLLVNVLLKWLFRRQRPGNPLIEPPADYGFPSGHSSAAFIFFGLLIYLIWHARLPGKARNLISAFLVLFSIAIGLSRIYLRVHYPTDVLAGFSIGAAWLCLSFVLYSRRNGAFRDKHQAFERSRSWDG